MYIDSTSAAAVKCIEDTPQYPAALLSLTLETNHP